MFNFTPKIILAPILAVYNDSTLHIADETLCFYSGKTAIFFPKHDLNRPRAIFSSSGNILKIRSLKKYFAILLNDIESNQKYLTIIDKWSLEEVQTMKASHFFICEWKNRTIMGVIQGKSVAIYDSNLNSCEKKLKSQLEEAIASLSLTEIELLSDIQFQNHYLRIDTVGMFKVYYIKKQREYNGVEEKTVASKRLNQLQLVREFAHAKASKLLLNNGKLYVLFRDKSFKVFFESNFEKTLFELNQVEDFALSPHQELLWIITKHELLKVDLKTWQQTLVISEEQKDYGFFKDLTILDQLIICRTTKGLVLFSTKSMKKIVVQGHYDYVTSDSKGGVAYVKGDSYVFKLNPTTIDQGMEIKPVLRIMNNAPYCFDDHYVYLGDGRGTMIIVKYHEGRTVKQLSWPRKATGYFGQLRPLKIRAEKNYLVVYVKGNLEVYSKPGFSCVKSIPLTESIIDMQISNGVLFVQLEEFRVQAYTLPELELVKTINVWDISEEVGDDFISSLWVDEEFVYLLLESDHLAIINHAKNWIMATRLYLGYKGHRGSLHSSQDYLIYANRNRLRFYAKKQNFALVKDLSFSNVNIRSVMFLDE